MNLYLSQQFMESQDLSNEDSKTNVNAGNEAEEASQVLGGDLTEVHGHHTETDTCGQKESDYYGLNQAKIRTI